ncbi:hypothetical protein [Pendulispora albinea]|uniref:Glycosyltransferase RgtA/B/C/D-like domain-containing protein n=1 Tax=Pendulispora albinea TaxID=2741071 RepID=A0ABZ2M5D5_9BACT
MRGGHERPDGGGGDARGEWRGEGTVGASGVRDEGGARDEALRAPEGAIEAAVTDEGRAGDEALRAPEGAVEAAVTDEGGAGDEALRARGGWLRGGGVDAVVVFALKVGFGVWLVARGLSHISDDDFARTVIAEQFAHAPRLDPSGTSWLPFPFWVTGGAMMAFGRSLDVARAVALGMSGVGAVLAHRALRAAGVGRIAAMAGIALAMASPWNAWLGATTVPEGFTGAFVAATAIGAQACGAGAAGRRCWVAVSAVLVCASLSRYEVWPACGVVALARIVAVVRAARATGRLVPGEWAVRTQAKNVAFALLPVAGCVAWMAWNLHAHGSATHFVARVTAYRHAIGAAGAPLGEKLAVYPRALLEAPEILLVSLAGFAAFAVAPTVRARWTLPLVTSLSVLAFLVYGETQEGAPTHHAARALVSIWWILAPFGVDGAHELVMRMTRRASWRAAAATAAVAGAGLAWSAARSDMWNLFSAQRGVEESRSAQLEQGYALRKAGAARLVVTPCAYEHFAWIAAYGAPESVEIRPASRAPVTTACPKVEQHAAP